MSETEITTIVVKILFAILSTAITYYILPFIAELTEKYKNERFEGFISDSVLAAEQVIKGTGKGAIKKEKVLKEASEWLKKYNIDISEEDLDIMIESVVFAMNHSEGLSK